ncbi:magnetosome protein Mad10 [Fundidesulfovibrio magnetotacticus]|uniref:Magnetosome protein Mad10 n=1 Tax=Fundidesulfovibrio magnetotacticus TaxID=2730080 RepID=A0A6V8LRS9_9BACT|nr:hypothetical protein [Fundidesulfovibrio magnetotacticus]GFK92307.1 magnetosome protein Mad10 [Fundidesulfovibrio magnetotacticus]
MQDSTKYHTLEHLGDIVVERIEAALEWLQRSTKGVSLTYRIHCMEKDREASYARIGRRTVSLRKRQPANELFSDEDMASLLAEFDEVDAELSRAKAEREARLYPNYAAQEQAV